MRKRILVVDDDADVAEPLRLALSRFYDVDFVANGAEATTRFADARYDAVVLDLMMPVMDGVAFKRWLDARQIAIPVLLVSGSDDLRERAEQMGVADHLAKPVDLGVLQERLGALLDRAAARSAGTGNPVDAAPALAAQGSTSR